ncbi:hypothetical protein AMTRI_Chr01g102600 [Amborella trichopoda]|uniref:uncharacterized protein LOC18425191 isoform X1 n=1 Tax=Amborella trichopoda TaxID=13333 RepID=UPI0005D44FCA|nr:uncharacterized protein LOC18425191 isoform X1 [Amborella trichopoda]|eukprot:XP_011629260.1 uncharacterized protein LOC18425191 isoform X1 [Amborella trichopoda]
MPCSSPLWAQISSWHRDYDKVQACAVFLIHIQIGCALIGSLGALYTGVLLINLAVALFALVAIESSSQSLGRTYAVLLVCSILLDISWFILFSEEIWNISAEKYGHCFIFSVRVSFWMQIVGFSMRLMSSLLWIQMYRMGVSNGDNSVYREADYDVRNSFLNPPIHTAVRQDSDDEHILGGSIYDPVYYSSLFEDATYKGHPYGIMGSKQQDNDGNGGSTSSPDVFQLKSCLSSSFPHAHDKRAVRKLPSF